MSYERFEARPPAAPAWRERLGLYWKLMRADRPVGWLLVAGIARIVFAIEVRKLVRGEWLLALSGVLAIALGVLFFARPDIGLAAMAVWVAVGALLYGVLQLVVALRMRRFSQVM